MAGNAKLNGPRYYYASIDTAPGEDGYWSDAVSMSKVNANELFLNVSGGGAATVTIQYKLPHVGATWTDYVTDETLETGARFRLDDHGAGVRWRVGVKNAVYSSGTVIVGFDW